MREFLLNFPFPESGFTLSKLQIKDPRHKCATPMKRGRITKACKKNNQI